jgi:hypothetical protein
MFPTLMKAAAIDRFGPPSVITVRTLPIPRPGPRQILIALRALSAVHPLGKAADAHRRLHGHVFGRIVLRIGRRQRRRQ